MDKTPANQLWGFFAEYYDDWITGQTGSLVINARTVRVLSRMFGRDTLDLSFRVWEASGDIHIFGNCEDLQPDAPCVELKGYPSRVVETKDEHAA